MSKIDVSVVLNMHQEALYLRPTLFSLDACALEAKANGIFVELIAVFDRADEATFEVFRTTPLNGFAAIKTAEVDVGSLGLARNAGIERAVGEFIWTADGDDLVSSNAIIELVGAARNHPHTNVVAFIEYLAAFGEQCHVVRYVGSEWLTAADFAFHHPFVSRIFVRRSIFDSLQYLDLKVTTGYAYEDWDFNCRLLAAGFDFKIAPETIFFYRQRGNSLLRQANAMSAKMIPHSSLFEPDCYRAAMLAVRERISDWPAFIGERQHLFERNVARELLVSERLVEYIVEAAALDPEIEPARIESAGSYCPIPWHPKHWGFQLESFYRLLGNQVFDDVVLLPWLKPGGAEKYILQILHQIYEINPRGRILVLSGESASKHEWATKLPKGSVFVDVFNAFPTLSEVDRDVMVVRALLALSEKRARLHIKSSPFTHRLMEGYGAVLSSQFRIVYYRFGDSAFFWHGTRLYNHWGVSFLRRQLANMDMLVCDCNKVAENDLMYFGAVGGKYHTVYAQSGSRLSLAAGRSIKHRLLWASRVSAQKRPELVGRIAMALRRKYPGLVIEVYGQVDAVYDQQVLFAVPGVVYRGDFDGFDSLPVERFDGFIYTSAFDGLPNIILEALSARLPVIAPDVGGVGEAVINDETGFLIPDFADDDALIGAYVDKVCRLYDNWNRTLEMAENGRRLIDERHGKVIFRQRILDVFAL